MTEPTEREALESLFADLHGTKDSIPLHRYTIKWRDRRDRFTTMLDAGAYLDAGLMLVDDLDAQEIMHEALRIIGRKHNLHIHLWPSGVDYRSELALALCATIEAAIARGGE